MTGKQAIDAYEQASGLTILGLDDREVHAIIDAVRHAVATDSDEDAMRAVLFLGHSESWTKEFLDKVRAYDTGRTK